MDIIAAVSRATATDICRYPRAHATDIPLATGTHFIKSGLPVCPVFPYRAVYSSKTSTLRWFTQFMQFMQTEQFMQFVQEHGRPVLSGPPGLIWSVY